jgi:hypothetical protein
MRQIRSTRVVPRQPRSRAVGGPCFSRTSGFAVGIATWRDQQAPRWLGDRYAEVLGDSDGDLLGAPSLAWRRAPASRKGRDPHFRVPEACRRCAHVLRARRAEVVLPRASAPASSPTGWSRLGSCLGHSGGRSGSLRLHRPAPDRRSYGAGRPTRGRRSLQRCRSQRPSLQSGPGLDVSTHVGLFGVLACGQVSTRIRVGLIACRLLCKSVYAHEPGERPRQHR